MNDKIEKIKRWLGTGSINIFGCPFSGKDTQANRIADILSGFMISSGDVIRNSKDTPEGKAVAEIMDRGELIPSDAFFKMVLPFFSKEEFQGRSLILSSVGRMKGEEEPVLKATKESGHETKAVVFLTLSDEEVWKRFDAAKEEGDRGNRNDDNRESIEVRLKKFQEETTPVIDFYREKGLLAEVNGEQSRDDVEKEIIQKLFELANNI